MSESDWDEPPTTTGASSMADESPGPVPEDQAPSGDSSVAAAEVQIRVTEPLVETFTIPNLGGLTIGRQWHSVSADQLEQIQDAARFCSVAIEVKEESQDAE